MVFSRVLNRSALFARSTFATRQIIPSNGSYRKFGSAEHAKKEYSGLEAFVRRYLPEDWQIVAVCATVEFGGLGLFIATRGGSEEAEAAPPSDIASSSIPSLISEEFEEWSKVSGNMEKWEASIDTW